MNENVQHIVLGTTDMPEVRNTPLGYSEVVAIVGHPVEVVNIEGRAVLYHSPSNNGAPVNKQAMKIAGPALGTEQIVGTAVLVGPLSAGSMETSLPDSVRDEVLETLRQWWVGGGHSER